MEESWIDQLAEFGWVQLGSDFLPSGLGSQLKIESDRLYGGNNFRPAKIGKASEQRLDLMSRSDEIFWLPEDLDSTRYPATGEYLKFWQQKLPLLCRSLLLPPLKYEFHYARYAVGSSYEKHIDQHKNNGNRVLSVITYLNPDWIPENKGELILYSSTDPEHVLTKISPTLGTTVIFRSEMFPHEVLAPVGRCRSSLTGWLRTT